MKSERAKKLREWQDNLYSNLKGQKATTVEFLGRTFIIPPNVHMINPMSDLIGNVVLKHTKSSDRVLDMGTGCGVNAILAASICSEVVAVDINELAIDAAMQNAQHNGVDSKISFSVSDLFASVEGKFDLKNEPTPNGGVPFDGVLAHWSDADYELMERVVTAVEVDLATGHPLRSDPVIAKFCALSKSFQEPAIKIAPHLTWKKGEVVPSSADPEMTDKEFRGPAYAMAALLPEANEAARLLEASGIPVWSRKLD